MAHPFPTLFLAFVLALAPIYVLYNRLHSYLRLRHVPGSLLSALTPFPRLFHVLSGRAHEHHLALHQRYGPVVRTGPNSISISSPSHVPIIYPLRAGFPKAPFYEVLRPYAKGGGIPGLFNTTDEVLHKELKNPIKPVFQEGNILRYEKFIDTMLEQLGRQLDSKSSPAGKEGGICDLGAWIMYFAFDVMGLMTFSSTYGFIEAGADVGGMHQTIFTYFKTAAPWTQVPTLDSWVNKNAFFQRFRKTPGMAILGIVKGIVDKRLAHEHAFNAEKKHSETDRGKQDKGDMLSQYLEIQRRTNIPAWYVPAWTFSNVVAGSDSVGTVAQTLLFNLLTHPASLCRLREELSSLPGPHASPIPYSELRGLSYLDACVDEASRLHPPFCLPLERTVPVAGITLQTPNSSMYIPGGTHIGGNAYVVNRDVSTFGSDPDAWRPERWLEVPEETRRSMEKGMLTFGAGRRGCMGKGIALMEIKKLIAHLVMKYELEVVDEERHTVENRWFFRHLGIYVNLSARKMRAKR